VADQYCPIGAVRLFVPAVSLKGVSVAAQTKDASQIDFLVGRVSYGPESPAPPARGFLWPVASKSFRERMRRVKKDRRYAKALQALMKRVNVSALLGESTLSVAAYPAVLASASDFLTALACASVISNRPMSKKGISEADSTI
jgi:hypothetical protein